MEIITGILLGGFVLGFLLLSLAVLAVAKRGKLTVEIAITHNQPNWPKEVPVTVEQTAQKMTQEYQSLNKTISAALEDFENFGKPGGGSDE